MSKDNVENVRPVETATADSESAAGQPLARVEHPDGRVEEFNITPPRSRKRSRAPSSPPPKPVKQAGPKRTRSAPRHVNPVAPAPSAPEADLSSLVSAAVAAALPSNFMQFFSDSATTPATALSALGVAGGGRRRSAPPSATVTSGMLADNVDDYRTLSVGADGTGYQFAGPVPSSEHQDDVLPLGVTTSSGRTPAPASTGRQFPASSGSDSAFAGSQLDQDQNLVFGQVAADFSACPAPPQWGSGSAAAPAPPTAVGGVSLPPPLSAPRPNNVPPPPPSSDAAGTDDFDHASVGDANSDSPPEQDLASRPYQEILAIISALLPEAVAEQDALQRIYSFSSSRLSASATQPPKFRALQSPLLSSALQNALNQYRGPSAATSSGSDLPSYPSGQKPGKFMKSRAPPCLKDGVVEGEVPRLPPPVTPADLAFTSSTPAQSVSSIPLSQILSSESSILSAMDLVSLGDIAVSSLATALFEPGTADFREDSDSIHAWRLLQFLESLQRDTASLLAGLFLSSLLTRRDHVLASAPNLSPELQTSLRLAPVQSTSLFGTAAHSAASVSSQENQQRAFQAVVTLATNQAKKTSRGGSKSSRGRGHSAHSGSNQSGRSHRGRGGSRGRSRGRGRGSGRDKQSSSSSANDDKKQNPQ